MMEKKYIELFYPLDNGLEQFTIFFDLYHAMKRLAIKQHAKCKQKTKRKTEFCRNKLKIDIVFVWTDLV